MVMYFGEMHSNTACSTKMAEQLTLGNGNAMYFSSGVNEGPHPPEKVTVMPLCTMFKSIYIYRRERLKFLLFGRSLDRDMPGKKVVVNASKINLDFCQCFFFKCVKKQVM